MKLLIITQAVDKDNPVLGFFHRWLEEFAKHFEKITVICLEKGRFNLPPNVAVRSLGKEGGESRVKYLLNFYRFIWQERKNYDSVFVHMNQEYVLLGGLIWKLFGNKIYLWRNHAQGNFLTRLAVWFSDKVFCTSPNSFTARFAKTRLMPVGIDTNFFQPDASVPKIPQSILFLGRMAPVKNVTLFIEALNELQKSDVDFMATIAGAALPQDIVYEKKVQELVVGYGLDNKVRFIGAVTQEQALRLYREHQLYVNLTPAGSLDKTIFEAMACGLPLVVVNSDLRSMLGERLIGDWPPTLLAEEIRRYRSNHEVADSRGFVVANHSLVILISRLLAELK